MTKLSCPACGQRYYGVRSHGARCHYCQAPLEDTGWSGRGRRATMMPLPLVEPAHLEPRYAGSEELATPLRR